MLEVIWSGSLERQGLCPGLSSYQGDACTAPVQDTDERYGATTHSDTARWRIPRGQKPVLKDQVVTLLQLGHSYTQILRKTQAPYRLIRTTAKELGIDRAAFWGHKGPSC